jgi:hypothetical protein
MYKRILIPTDGSPLARKALKEGIALAKAVGASVFGYTAIEPIERIYYSEGAGVRAGQAKAIEKQLRDQGEQYVEVIRKAATAAGVASEGADRAREGSVPRHHRRGTNASLRPDLHRLARARKHRDGATGQRYPESARALEDSRARLPLRSPATSSASGSSPRAH